MMKKTIDNKVYNTETAIHVAGYWNGRGNPDPKNLSEDLYLSPKGQWFLSGEGGSLTKYSVPCGNGSSRGSDITLLTSDEALAWVVANQKFIDNSDGVIDEHFKDKVTEG